MTFIPMTPFQESTEQAIDRVVKYSDRMLRPGEGTVMVSERLADAFDDGHGLKNHFIEQSSLPEGEDTGDVSDHIVKGIRCHIQDSDCTLDVSDCCMTCGAYHGEPCRHCGQRAFHAYNCPTQTVEL